MSLSEFIRQISILLTLPAVVLLGIAAATIVVVRDWRLSLFAYAVLSVDLAVLLSQRLPMEWALLQAITGGLVAVMLFLSARQFGGAWHLSPEARWPQLVSLGIFRLLTTALAFAAFLALHTYVELPLVNEAFRDAIVWSAMAGMLGLALHEEPLHAGLALLTLLGGFLLLLYTLSQDRMLVGLMEAWQLLLGLAVSYLVVSRGLAESEAPDETAPARWQQ